jgi:hypothetical protein
VFTFFYPDEAALTAVRGFRAIVDGTRRGRRRCAMVLDPEKGSSW